MRSWNGLGRQAGNEIIKSVCLRDFAREVGQPRAVLLALSLL